MEILQHSLQFSGILLILFKIVLSKPELYQTKDGIEYLIEIDNKYNWLQASNECARQGLQLVVIDSEEKNLDLIDLLKELFDGIFYDFWLGGYDLVFTKGKHNRPFYWAPTGQKFEYTYWSPNNPNNAQYEEHCVHIWKVSEAYRWNDNQCGNVFFGYICENTDFANHCHTLVNELIDLLPCD